MRRMFTHGKRSKRGDTPTTILPHHQARGTQPFSCFLLSNLPLLLFFPVDSDGNGIQATSVGQKITCQCWLHCLATLSSAHCMPGHWFPASERSLEVDRMLLPDTCSWWQEAALRPRQLSWAVVWKILRSSVESCCCRCCCVEGMLLIPVMVMGWSLLLSWS